MLKLKLNNICMRLAKIYGTCTVFRNKIIILYFNFDL